MKKLFCESFFVVLFLFLINIPSINATTVEGTSDNGILVTEWTHPLYENGGYYGWGYFGSSPGIADFGSDVGDGDENLEIVTGSDAYYYYESDLGSYVPGAWHMFSYDGTTVWAKSTQADEARGDVGIADLNNDGFLEIAAGTTSGMTVEVMDRFGNFVWTFPDPPTSGNFMWPGGTAIDDVDSNVDGLEIIIGNRPEGRVYAFDGDNSDGNDDGITMPAWPSWSGTEGISWDVLWTYDIGGEIFATAAIGDLNNDGSKEVVIGSTNGKLVALDAKTGTEVWTFTIAGGFYSSVALADYDGNGDLEVVVGSTNGKVYFIDGDLNTNGTIDLGEYTSYDTGSPVYSSAAVGDVDVDGDLETLIGSNDGALRSFDYDPTANTVALNWSTTLGGVLYSSPSLANRTVCQEYQIEWPMFRHDLRRTGFYGPTSAELDVYIGSTNGNLYLIDGATGAIMDSFFVGTFIKYGIEKLNEIRTSPSIADVDNDGQLEVFFYEWGSEDTFWAVEDTHVSICDDEGPITSNVLTTPMPVAVNTPFILNAIVDDTFTGGSSIISADFSIDSGGYISMNASDGSFDEVTEEVTISLLGFDTTGLYMICVNGTDYYNNVGADDCMILPVYDPDAGFVTGGGWIYSDPGAYVPDQNFEGKANFGFVSKYKKGATVPTGNTEFQFHAAGMNFHSDSYEWLVVTGSNYARFKGVGTINGEGVYKFMLWAGDGKGTGGADTFRIKIWTEDEITDVETVIYDNGFDQEIGGGSIVIHTKK